MLQFTKNSSTKYTIYKDGEISMVSGILIKHDNEWMFQTVGHDMFTSTHIADICDFIDNLHSDTDQLFNLSYGDKFEIEGQIYLKVQTEKDIHTNPIRYGVLLSGYSYMLKAFDGNTRVKKAGTITEGKR